MGLRVPFLSSSLRSTPSCKTLNNLVTASPAARARDTGGRLVASTLMQHRFPCLDGLQSRWQLEVPVQLYAEELKKQRLASIESYRIGASRPHLVHALWQLLTLEVVRKRAFLAKNDTGRRAVSKYDAWAMHPPKDDTRPVCVLKYDTRPVCLLKYDTRSPCIQKYDSERPHCQKNDTQPFLCKKTTSSTITVLLRRQERG